MCGIVGYVGDKPCSEVLINGLKRLEYRGYDSAGLALLRDGAIDVVRQAGKIANLEKEVENIDLKSKIGIGHTRWATHGHPTEANAHPHVDCTGKIAVVHNGIIENFASLKSRLMAEGHVFKSETDTETIVHLIEKYYDGDLVKAVEKAIPELEGSFAFVAISSDSAELMVAARKDSPLVVGLGNGENFIASDIPALISYTKDVLIMSDREMAVVTASDVKLMDFEGNFIDRDVYKVTWNSEAAEKSGYEDFMLKEIFEQPLAIKETIRGRVDKDGKIALPELELSEEEMRRLNKIYIVACGTSFHAGMVAKYVMEHWCRIPVEIDIASEYRYRDPIIDPDSLVVAITQSGETADTLAGVRDAKLKGGKVVAITNVIGSTVTRDSDGCILTHAGPEIGVAATKTLVAQISALYVLALKVAQARGTLDQELIKKYCHELMRLPEVVEETLLSSDLVKECALKFADTEDFFFIGRGVGLPVAMEGALKLKEISYIHAEGYPAGELKHGPIALIYEDVPIVAVATKSGTYEKVVSNIQEVRARNAAVIAVATEGDENIKNYSECVFFVPETLEHFSAIPAVVPLQLLAYFIAKKRGCDVDQPRNLAKSVTVE